jgi:hypothetical protein
VKRSGQSTGTEHTVCSFQDYPINIQKNQRLQHDYTNEQAYTEITTEKNKTSRCRSTNQAKPVQRHPTQREYPECKHDAHAAARTIPETSKTRPRTKGITMKNNTLDQILNSNLASVDPGFYQFALAKASSDLFKRIINK